jgi:hypothetical protein
MPHGTIRADRISVNSLTDTVLSGKLLEGQ